MTLNSRTESCGGEIAMPLKSPIVFETPSSRTSLVAERPPLTEKLESKKLRLPGDPIGPWAFPFSLRDSPRPCAKPPSIAPGTRLMKASVLRSPDGRSSMSLLSIVVSSAVRHGGAAAPART